MSLSTRGKRAVGRRAFLQHNTAIYYMWVLCYSIFGSGSYLFFLRFCNPFWSDSALKSTLTRLETHSSLPLLKIHLCGVLWCNLGDIIFLYNTLKRPTIWRKKRVRVNFKEVFCRYCSLYTNHKYVKKKNQFKHEFIIDFKTTHKQLGFALKNLPGH